MIPLKEQIATVAREIAIRKRTYPKWVASGKMKADMMEREILAMQAVLDTLTGLRRGPHDDMFGEPKP